MTVIEVFADVSCPFTHVGLRQFVERRAALGREEVRLRVRAWPLEIVNGAALDGEFIAEEVNEIRAGLKTDLFRGFTAQALPSSSLPAMALAAAAYDVSMNVGEAVSLELRDLLFEVGADIADPTVLSELADHNQVPFNLDDTSAAVADHALGVERGVIGSPHFFTSTASFFCPALDVSRDSNGRLQVKPKPEVFAEFINACFA
ncbi:MAG TPA: DsbA family protein [Microthrixaceae bacterium]|nr:DsbA family protein [Microthrixaceae bacterium]